MGSLTKLARSKSDPKIIETGPSSVYPEDRAAKSLGWFSIALGAVETLAANRVARALGMEGSETIIRAFGAREIASGMVTLSPERNVGLWSRVGGDALDIAFLLRALSPTNPQRGNVKIAMLAVAGITALDVATALAVTARRRRGQPQKFYRDRSGFPRGLSAVRGRPIPPKRATG
jgi:hypothetical protein